MSFIESLQRLRRTPSQDRGAVLLVLSAALFVLLAAAGIAVDLASRQTQAQELQNAADAAALGGVQEWATSGNEDAARAVVNDLLSQNAVLEHDVTWDISFPSSTEVQVAVNNGSPDVFMGALFGANRDLTRDASAVFTPCAPTCGTTLDIPRPFEAINYGGDGDGYRPILVGDKVYAARHHDRTMTCIDRRTNDLCWDTDSRNLFDDSELFTMNVTHTTLIGTRLFYLGFEDNWGQRWQNYPSATGALYVGCWETLTDTRCGDTLITSGERHGMLAANEDGLFIFTNHRNVYCLNPDTLESCNGYSGGRTMAAFSEKWDNTKTAMRNSTFRTYDGRIYTTIAYKGPHYLQCWNTNSKAPCSGFGTFEVNDNSAIGGKDPGGDIWVEGRLFFSRLTDGTPNAICSSGKNQVECFDLVGGTRLPAIEGPLNSFAASWAAMTASTPSAGQHTYHETSNRTFFLGQTNGNRTYCWDWATGDCGRVHHVDGLGEPRPYGYWATPECLFGLGHNKIFWTLKPDMSGGCDQGAARVTVEPCLCDGEQLWPEVTMRNAEGVEGFEVRVLDEAGDVIFPTDDGVWLNLVAGDSVDIAEIVGEDFTPVTLEIVVSAATGHDPWADGQFPALNIVSPGFQPHLTQ